MSGVPAPLSPRLATSADRAAIEALLLACDLPPDGVQGCLGDCLLVEQDEVLLGCAAIEVCDDAVLLRSLAVTPRARARGIAATLVDTLQERARARGAGELWLLTDSAADWFAARGWRTMSRETAPPGVRTHAQFLHLCPASACLMRRAL